MSIEIMTRVWKIDGLSQGEKLVLLSLADNANDSGICWPSISAIAERCCMQERSVTRTIGELEQRGYVRRELRTGKQTLYHVTPDNKTPLSLSHPDNKSSRHNDTPTPDIKSGGDDIKSPLPNNPNKEITLKEPKGEPSRRARPEKYSVEFEEFWQAYPKNGASKAESFKSYQRALRDGAEAAVILAAVPAYAAYLTSTDTPVAHATTWLNQQRWTVDYPGLKPADEQAKPVEPVNLTLESIGDDTPENRGMLQMLEALRQQHGDAIFRSWLMRLRLQHKNCTVLTLEVPTKFMAEWINQHYAADLVREAARVWPEINTVTVAPGKH